MIDVCSTLGADSNPILTNSFRAGSLGVAIAIIGEATFPVGTLSDMLHGQRSKSPYLPWSDGFSLSNQVLHLRREGHLELPWSAFLRNDFHSFAGLDRVLGRRCACQQCIHQKPGRLKQLLRDVGGGTCELLAAALRIQQGTPWRTDFIRNLVEKFPTLNR